MRPTDRSALASFICSTGPWYEAEVQTFIQTGALRRHLWRQPHTDHRLLVLETDAHGIIAVGSHEERDGEFAGQAMTITYLESGAVRMDCQGALLPDVPPFEDGRPVSVGRYLMEALLSDSAERDRDPYIRAVVARQNYRSLRLCARLGLTDKRDDQDERYVELFGVHPEAGGT